MHHIFPDNFQEQKLENLDTLKQLHLLFPNELQHQLIFYPHRQINHAA